MTMTAKEIVSVLGPVDETLMADISATGATLGELAEAWAWVNNDEALIGEGRTLPSGKVATLVDLLSADEDDEFAM
ncbi:hypothetical protein ACXHXG_25825 [Rhizobium sp. LEGMi198b]|uniref:hypothetical protein n=1 Tax=unclassified Rhizobium TaxID=2613769 RepID=UPI000CDF4E48|nr:MULTISPECIES: hypothetical protein [Rhizobium]AVA25095.1 hypothetical protein NXC24_PC00650 [Rhizobium sp. NXC24]MDK4741113.1 hypothetical protein [Rhizobium sp. CNPSo 3464]UWU24881.1 hypothetical protein N2601_22340 [Rhizobium tropici]WFU04233.1 hypothetical protein QA648_25925 [Rhizobium sp. CB3171]